MTHFCRAHAHQGSAEFNSCVLDFSVPLLLLWIRIAFISDLGSAIVRNLTIFAFSAQDVFFLHLVRFRSCVIDNRNSVCFVWQLQNQRQNHENCADALVPSCPTIRRSFDTAVHHDLATVSVPSVYPNTVSQFRLPLSWILARFNLLSQPSLSHKTQALLVMSMGPLSSPAAFTAKGRPGNFAEIQIVIMW